MDKPVFMKNGCVGVKDLCLLDDLDEGDQGGDSDDNDDDDDDDDDLDNTDDDRSSACGRQAAVDAGSSSCSICQIGTSSYNPLSQVNLCCSCIL